MPSEPIVICCAADEEYVMPLATMVKSLLMNTSTHRSISLYLVDGGISEASKQRLLDSWDTKRLTVNWLYLDTALFSDLPLWGRMKAITYYRLMMPEFLPRALHKAIWLDSDMIIRGNVAELWDIDLGDNGVLAVQDLVIPYVSSPSGISYYEDLRMTPDTKYFNAGVMVVNLDWWRQNDVASRVFGYLRRYQNTVVFWDQEGLNAVLVGKWGELDPRWNQNASVCGRPFFTVEHLDTATYQQVVNDPWVVHFAGGWKPWIYHSHNPSHLLYYQYLDMTAWAGWRPQKTLKSIIMGIYDSSYRDLLYPLERWIFEFLRTRALSKHTTKMKTPRT